MLKYENDFRISLERLTDLAWVTTSPESDLDDYVDLLNDALGTVRAWRRMMDASTTFVTPNLLNCLRYLDGEAREVLGAWMKATLKDPRRRTSDSTEDEEMGHVTVMALTALLHVEHFSFDKSNISEYFQLMDARCKEASSVGFTYYDTLCLATCSAYAAYFELEGSGDEGPMATDLAGTLWLCMKCSHDFVGGIVATLEAWQKRGSLLPDASWLDCPL